MSPIEQALYPVLQYIAKQKQHTVLIACSAGGDSVALLAAAAHLRQKVQLFIEVIYVNHGIREKKQLQEEYEVIMKLQQIFPFPFHCTSIARGYLPREMQRKKKSLEDIARIHRYRVFSHIMKQRKIRYVLTGHHQNDSIETTLFHIFQGHFFHLRGIPLTRDMPHGSIIRPFLTVQSYELRQYVILQNLPYHEDASNKDVSIIRNRIRHRIIPELKRAFPSIEKNLLRLCKQADMFTARGVVPKWEFHGNYASINAQLFSQSSPADRLLSVYNTLQEFSKRRCLHQTSSTYQRVSHSFFKALLEFKYEKPAKIRLIKAGNWCIELYKKLIIWYASEEGQERGYFFYTDARDVVATYCRNCYDVNLEEHRYEMSTTVMLRSSTYALRSVQSCDRIATGSGNMRVKDLLDKWDILPPVRSHVPVLEDEKGVVVVLGKMFGGVNVFYNKRKDQKMEFQTRVGIRWRGVAQ